MKSSNIQAILRRGFCGMVACVLACLVGCGGGEFAQVTGTVTLDGKPLANAEVEFMPAEGGGPSYGTTDSNGRYSLTHSSLDRGAVIGQHTVSIQLAEPEEEYDAEGTDEGTLYEDQSKEANALPARYNEETELTAEVTKGGDPIDFDLTSDS